MADDLRKGFMVSDEPAQPTEPRGGLASRSLGGLAKFVGDVNKGLEMVLSNPLYKRVWAGAVSGQAQDATAGPRALAQMEQNALDQRYQQTQMQREEEEYTTGKENDLLRRKHINELRDAVEKGDRMASLAALFNIDPVAATKYQFEQQKSGRPVQAIRDGQAVWVSPEEAVGLAPVPRGPLVSIFGDDLNPYQKAQTRQQILDDHRAESEVYTGVTGRVAELDAILNEIGEGEPTPFQSEAAATAFTKGVKPTEAVMRDDISRVLGQGWQNQLKGYFNLPQKASKAQILEMRAALATIQGVAEMRQRAIDEKYRALGSDYRVEIPTFVRPEKSSDVLNGLPEGSVFDEETGLWTAPDGRMFVEE